MVILSLLNLIKHRGSHFRLVLNVLFYINEQCIYSFLNLHDNGRKSIFDLQFGTECESREVKIYIAILACGISREHEASCRSCGQ